MEDIFRPIQASMLFLFGYPISSKTARASNDCSFPVVREILRTTIGMVFIGVCICVYLYQSGHIGIAAIEGRLEKPVSFMYFLEILPEFTVALRGLLVLTLFVLKRKAWIKLFLIANELLKNIFKPDERKQFFYHLRKVSILLGIMPAVAMIVRHSIPLIFRFLKSKNLEFYSAQSNQTSALKSINASQSSSFDYNLEYSFTIAFQIAPFVVSQQVCVIAMTIGMILTSSLQKINHVLIQLQNVVRGSRPSCDNTQKAVDDQEHEVEHIIGLYQEIVDLAETFHHHFRFIIGGAYGLDICTMLGYVASLVGSESGSDIKNTASITHNIFNVVVFSLFPFVLAVPLVRYYEKVNFMLDTLRSPYNIPFS
jgi:hypothetical protein